MAVNYFSRFMFSTKVDFCKFSCSVANFYFEISWGKKKSDLEMNTAVCLVFFLLCFRHRPFRGVSACDWTERTKNEDSLC